MYWLVSSFFLLNDKDKIPLLSFGFSSLPSLSLCDSSSGSEADGFLWGCSHSMDDRDQGPARGQRRHHRRLLLQHFGVRRESLLLSLRRLLSDSGIVMQNCDARSNLTRCRCCCCCCCCCSSCRRKWLVAAGAAAVVPSIRLLVAVQLLSIVEVKCRCGRRLCD